MLNIRVTTKFNRFPQITAQIRPAASSVVTKTAHDIEAAIKLEMRAPKSGRLYRRGSRSHQASAPGQAPAVDFGQLINSIQVNSITDLISSVGTNVEYAPALEYGSRRVAPRPVWRPVTESKRKAFVQAMTAVLRQIK